VFKDAAARGVAIEIDGDPARQDLDYQLADRARESGCLLALDNDAQDTEAFIYTDTAIADARLAGIPASWVINCWDQRYQRERIFHRHKFVEGLT
jgi:histidinol phosphatase-like PHP family hydrolase